MDPAAGSLQSSDDTVRIAALHALTESSMLHPDILADVRVALLSPSSLVRRAALVCWQRTGCGPDDDVRAGMLHRDREVRIAALSAVCRWGADEALSACRMALRDSHDDVVRVALLLLSMQHLPIEPEVLLSHLADANQMIAIKTAVLLAERGHADGEAAVAGYLAQTDSTAFPIVVRLIGAVGLTRYGAVLQAQLHPHHPHLAVLVQALGRLAEPSAIRPILSYLAHHNDHIRSCAVHALITMNDQRIVPALRGATADCRPYVRIAATWTLAGMDEAIDPLVLRDILIHMRTTEAVLWVKQWLRGDVERICERIIRLHTETDWCLSSDARSSLRGIIATHPDAQQIRLHLHACADPQISRTLLPLYTEGVLPLLSADVLVHILADDYLRKGSRLRALADIHIQRDPQTLRTFWSHADDWFHQFYGEYCLLTMDHRWHALIWQTASRALHRQYLKHMSILVRVAPGFVATIPPDGIEWLQRYRDPADPYENECVQYVCGFWEVQQAHASLPPASADPYASPDVFLAWAAPSARGVAQRLIHLHENPLMSVTTQRRALLRAVIQTHPDAPEICTILHDARHPALAVTLIPWYVSGALPPIDPAVYALMPRYSDDQDIRMQRDMRPPR